MSSINILHIGKEPSSKAIDLMINNEIGQRGKGIVYEHKTVKKKLSHLQGSDVDYLEVRLKKRVVGVCAFVNRTMNGHSTPISYVRYFTFAKAFRVTKPMADSHFKGGSSKLKNSVDDYLSSHDRLHYAYVDLSNERSKKICEQFGFRKHSSFSTIIFSRLNPIMDKNVFNVNLHEIRDRIRSFYRDYCFYTESNHNYKEAQYYVYKKDGNIKAGLIATPEFWEIKDMPSALGKLLLNWRLPVMSKLFSPDYHFLAIEGIFYESGYENKITTILSHILKLSQLHAAMIWCDTTSSLYKDLLKLDLGLLHKINGTSEAQVIIRGNVDLAGPVYISGFDLT